MQLSVLVVVVLFAETYSTIENSLKPFPILKHSTLLTELISRSFVNRTNVVSIYTAPKSYNRSDSVFAMAGAVLGELRDDFLITSYRDLGRFFDCDYNVIVSDSIHKVR